MAEPYKTQFFSDLSAGTSLTVEFEMQSPAVLVEILGEDTNFRSEIFDADNRVISTVKLEFLRSAPVYHLIEGAENQRHVLEVRPIQTTSQAEVTINWYALPAKSASDRKTLDAWRELASGIQLVESEDPAHWEDNLASLHTADEKFTRLNRSEQALWARYFRAYFEYYPLYRYSESLSAAERIIKNAEALEIPRLQLLGHQLAGQILLEREAGVDEAQARRDYEAAQAHFRSALPLAREMDNGFETIWVFNNMGITSKYQDDPEKALNEYKSALDLAIEIQDRYLVNLIGMNMAVAQESLGKIRNAIETFHRVEAELLQGGDHAELQHVWSHLGRYYLRLYDFPKTLQYLNQALRISKERGNAEGRARIHELLARTYSEMGQPEKSLAYIELALPDLESSRNGRGLRRAYSLAADLHRVNGDYSLMHDSRRRQGDYLATDADRADWYFSQALDADAEGNAQHAIELFRESARIQMQTPFQYRAELALLHACVLEVELRKSARCSSEWLDAETRTLRSHQASSYMLEGRYLWARLLSKEGRIDLARLEMDQLIYDVEYFRQQLPGVLGAWYWDARGDIFGFYMALALQSEQESEQTAYDSLAAINRLRNTSLQRGAASQLQGTAGSRQEESSQQIRQLISLRERAETLEDIEQAQRGIDLFLLEHRPRVPGNDLAGNAAELRRQLENLPDDWCLLTYHVAENLALMWFGTNQGLKLYRMGDGAELGRIISSARLSIRAANNDGTQADIAWLGENLIGPAAKDLRPNILFAGSGALSGFPLEALIVNEEYLIKDFRVHNLMSMDRLNSAIDAITEPVRPQRLFLAGNPDTGSGKAPTLPGSAAELLSVAESFPEASSASFQWNQLLRGAFQSEEFTSADLIHIASHATIDVAYPEFSRIELSSDFLTPSDLQHQRVSAKLVVLSACSTAGLNQFEYDSNLGFVSEFLNAGADQVIASLWPIGDRVTHEFFKVFYRAVGSGINVSEALRLAKLRMIDTGSTGVDNWGAFQLYLQ